jgi:hypothetical protein
VQTFTGVGSKVVRLEPICGAVLVIFQTGDGNGYTALGGLDSTGAQVWLGANVVGPYSGVTLYAGEDDLVAFKVTSDSGWSLAVRPVSDARVWSGPQITGMGDDVLELDEPVAQFTTIAINRASDGYTGVWGYSETDAHLLFNAVGAGQEENVLPVGTWLIAIRSDAPWGMARG